MKKEKKIKILMSGGSGLLGRYISAIDPNIIAPKHSEMDVLDVESIVRHIDKHQPKVFLHCAAFTSPPKCDQDPIKAIQNNIIGTANVTQVCSKKGVRLIYVSTDYVFRGYKGMYKEDDELLPQNKYAWSKLGGECAVRLYDNSLIIRTSFCPEVFAYEKAFIDHFTSRDSVVVIAKMIYSLVTNLKANGIVHVGTERKTVKDLAIKLGKKNIGDLKREEVPFVVPYDTSLDTSKLKKYIKNEERW